MEMAEIWRRFMTVQPILGTTVANKRQKVTNTRGKFSVKIFFHSHNYTSENVLLLLLL